MHHHARAEHCLQQSSFTSSNSTGRLKLRQPLPCRGTWKYPFKPRSGRVLLVRPRIVCTLRPVSKCQIYNIEKVYKTHSTLIRTINTKDIPSLKCVRVVQVTSRHSCKTLEVLRKECQVYSQEEQEEVSLSMLLRILTTSLFTYPKIESPKNSKTAPILNT
jgi:hypothetical protein